MNYKESLLEPGLNSEAQAKSLPGTRGTHEGLQSLGEIPLWTRTADLRTSQGLGQILWPGRNFIRFAKRIILLK